MFKTQLAFTIVPAAVDQRVPRLPVGGDRGSAYSSVLIADVVGLLHDGGALGTRVADAAVDVGVDPALEHEPDGAGPQDVGVIPARTLDEPRWLVIGQIEGKHWSVVVTYRGERVRITSARRSRKEETTLYEG